MKNSPFKNGLSQGFGIFLAIATLGVITVFAANWYDSILVTTGETLTATKWNNLAKATTPTGAIMAFNLTTCPDTWTEYTLARGRFLRGIDSTGVNDSVRVLGDLQADDFKSHTHEQNSETMYNHTPAYFSLASGAYANISVGGIIHLTTIATGGTETRPKNVSVLYCVKQ